MTPMKIVQFSRAPPPLSIYVQNSSIPLTLDVQFQINPHPSPNDNQSIKRTHNPRMTIICYQVLVSLFYFFSFSWSLTIYFFVALYSCVCSCPKISQNVFYLQLFTFLVLILQSTCFTRSTWKRKQTMEQQPRAQESKQKQN